MGKTGTVTDTPTIDVAQMRVSYGNIPLLESDVAPDWATQFSTWLAQAVAAEVKEPNAFVLATATADGIPASRTVLAKAIDVAGVTFYTNYDSAKSHDLDANPRASATFPWYQLHRQVHVRGTVERVDRQTAEAYWRTRPRGSQLGAWASPQSTVLGSFPAAGEPQDFRTPLDQRQTELEDRFGGGPAALDAPAIPLPPNWGGWRIVPGTVEFWQGRNGRMHDRLRYRLDGDTWVVERLAP